MIRRPLEWTLLELVKAVSPQENPGMVVTEVLLEAPLEVFTGIRDGKPIVYAAPPHTRWKSGILPPVHQCRLHVTLWEPDQGRKGRTGSAG